MNENVKELIETARGLLARIEQTEVTLAEIQALMGGGLSQEAMNEAVRASQESLQAIGTLDGIILAVTRMATPEQAGVFCALVGLLPDALLESEQRVAALLKEQGRTPNAERETSNAQPEGSR